MTSQRWLTDADFAANSVAKSIWWHYLAVVVPEKIRFKNNGSLYITKGHNDWSIPDEKNYDILACTALALITGQITGCLFDIPNQNIIYAADPTQENREEDATIAFTWAHFLNDPTDPTWLIRFPMVKASIRGMDTMTAFVNDQLPQLGCNLQYYSVAGASKRGWTTWLVGAVDPNRVKVIIPMVLDAINFLAVEHHEYKSYGGWGYALAPYREMNLTLRFDDPNFPLLQQMIDPYFYRERLTMPKLVVNSGMDEFQQPDDTHYWWNDMPGPKHFLLAPNTEHEMVTGILEIIPAIGAYVIAQNQHMEIPEFVWTIDNVTGEIVATMEYDRKIVSAAVWWAYSCGFNAWDGGKARRDFRIGHMDVPCKCGIALNNSDFNCFNLKALWFNQDLQPSTDGNKRIYRAMPGREFKKPANNDTWVAFFIAFKFYNSNAQNDTQQVMKEIYTRAKGSPEYASKRFVRPGNAESWPLPEDLGGYLEFNTEASVWPDTFPYPDCDGPNCNQQVV
uniref:Uncharacterized protein n=1 Tax=Acrobeloides nanus TaxID=290746 RepID=A0A914DK95_9BILA